MTSVATPLDTPMTNTVTSETCPDGTMYRDIKSCQALGFQHRGAGLNHRTPTSQMPAPQYDRRSFTGEAQVQIAGLVPAPPEKEGDRASSDAPSTSAPTARASVPAKPATESSAPPSAPVPVNSRA